MKEEISILWLKRDLRLHDHGGFEYCQNKTEANPNFRSLILYVEEEGYWQSEKASQEQRLFVHECLNDLQLSITKLQNKLIWLKSEKDCLTIFEKLSHFYNINEVITHRETGNKWTFDRDKKIKRFLKSNHIILKEFKQDCLTRGSETQRHSFNSSFSQNFYNFNNQTQYKVPSFIRPPKHYPAWIKESSLYHNELSNNLPHSNNNLESFRTNTHIQTGGETEAINCLTSFLDSRCLVGYGYRKEMSNPLVGKDACSRISAHLSWGSLSLRSTIQTTNNALQELNKRDPKRHHLSSFAARLAWRSHFMQKFETLSWMEFKCLNKNRENLRGWDEAKYHRWSQGMTGYPFVDACIRSLNATKWLNFRARAMVVSFASYALNLDWRGFGPHLAKNFLDYEPGIHYSQLQMQGGTTIGSPTRIYSPIKQSIEKDPTGEFIRLWVPELRDINNSLIHIPSDCPRNGYPSAIVPQSILWSVMRTNGPRKEVKDVARKVPKLTASNKETLLQAELFS